MYVCIFCKQTSVEIFGRYPVSFGYGHKEIIIPAEFDDVYEKYNAIQKEQGFDLTAYCSKRVKKWTYKVTNYPNYEGSDCIRATLLVFDGKVIGGDVCSVELDGFMHGFVKN